MSVVDLIRTVFTYEQPSVLVRRAQLVGLSVQALKNDPVWEAYGEEKRRELACRLHFARWRLRPEIEARR